MVHTTVWNYHLWLIFVHVSVLSLFHVQISIPVESVFWFHMVIISPSQPHYIPSPLWSEFGVNFLLCGSLKFDLLWSLFTGSGQWSALGVVSLCCTGYIKAHILGTEQIWQSYIGDTTGYSAERNHDVIWLKASLGRDLHRYEKIYIYICRILHALGCSYG